MADLRSRHRSVARLAAQQHGLFTRQQARDCGLTDRQIDGRLRSGQYLVHRRGVFVIAGVPPTWEQAVQSAVLASVAGSMAGGPTAAHVWAMKHRPPEQGIHILSPSDSGRARRAGIVPMRSTLLVPADRGRTKGIEVSSPARTLADCSGLMERDQLASAVDDALRRDLITVESLRATAARLMTPGRPRTNLAHVISLRLPGYDPGDSDLEVAALARLRRAGFAVPAQQHPVLVEGRRLHIDLAYPDLMIGIELDGWEWHRHRTSFDRDRRRLSWLTAAGWAMLVPTSQTLGDLVPQLRMLVPRQQAVLRPPA